MIKKMTNRRPKKAFLSLLGLLAAIMIICILAFSAFKFYFKKPVLDEPAEKFAQEQNINTTNYQSMLTDTKSKLEDATQREIDRTKEIEGLR